MTYLVSLHNGGGSMGEAMDAEFEFHVETENDAAAIVRAIKATIYYKQYGNECRIISRNLNKVLTGDDATEALFSDENIVQIAYDYADEYTKEEFELFPEVTSDMVAQCADAWSA